MPRWFRNLLGRGASAADTVAICIPAWQAEKFIGQTLGCAVEQTHKRLRVLISVDFCTDATGDICRSLARTDPRIRVFLQKEQLGWARNVNFLLDQVQEPFFFIYFHDDQILPQYTERLLAVLRARSKAISCHCDMGHFGRSDYVSIGRNYQGSTAERLATFLVAPNRGSPLRSLTRSEAIGCGLRLPQDTVGGFWANEPYLMRLLAIGPAIRVPEILYRRWDQREGGLTDGWKKLSSDQVLSGFRTNIATARSIIHEAVASTTEREALIFCLYVHMMPRIRVFEREAGIPPIDPADLNPAFSKLEFPSSLKDLGPKIETWALQCQQRLQHLEQTARQQ